MLDPGPERYLQITRRFKAAPERVFNAWLDLAQMRQWLFAMPGDEDWQGQAEARVGGQWRITATRGGQPCTASGEYQAIDAPRRLVFTFAMLQFSPNSDTITVEIEPEGDGCVLTLTQTGTDIAHELRSLPPGVVSGSESGWRQMLDKLSTLL